MSHLKSLIGLPEERTQHSPNPCRWEVPCSMAWPWAVTEEESSDLSLPPASAQARARARATDSGWHAQTSGDQADPKNQESAISYLRMISRTTPSPVFSRPCCSKKVDAGPEKVLFSRSSLYPLEQVLRVSGRHRAPQARWTGVGSRVPCTVAACGHPAHQRHRWAWPGPESPRAEPHA